MKRRKRKNDRGNRLVWAWRIAQVPLGLLLPFLTVGLALHLGSVANRSLDARSGAVDFTGIACDVPPGADRERFLREVQYLGCMPDRLDPSDPAVASELSAAFGSHPEVSKVVAVEADRGLSVDLQFRTPAEPVVASISRR